MEFFDFVKLQTGSLFLVCELQSFVYQHKRQWKLLKSRLRFKKIAYFTGKLLQNHKLLECEISRILLKHVSVHVSVLFQFAWLYL